MDTNFTNSENGTLSDTQRLLLDIKDKINSKRSNTCVALSNFSMHYT